MSLDLEHIAPAMILHPSHTSGRMRKHKYVHQSVHKKNSKRDCSKMEMRSRCPNFSESNSSQFQLTSCWHQKKYVCWFPVKQSCVMAQWSAENQILICNPANLWTSFSQLKIVGGAGPNVRRPTILKAFLHHHPHRSCAGQMTSLLHATAFCKTPQQVEQKNHTFSCEITRHALTSQKWFVHWHVVSVCMWFP